jgi:hypothetical protein
VMISPASEEFKFAKVLGTNCEILDKRPEEVESIAVSSDEPYLVLVHEACADEFKKRVFARIWPSRN